MKKVMMAAGAALAVLALASCSSDTSDQESSEAGASPTATSDILVGNDPATWTPVTVTADDNGGVIRMVVGQTAVINGFETEATSGQLEVQTSDPMIVEAIQPVNSDWVGAPGFTAISPGVVDVVVAKPTDGLGEALLTVTVVVEPNSNDGVSDSTMMGTDPSTWAPTMIDPTREDISLLLGQNAVFPDYEYGPTAEYSATSDNPAVVAVLPAEDSMVVAIQAVGLGTATVTVADGDAVIQTIQVAVE